MLDLIIISYKLTINMSVTYKEYIQYPVDNTYNNAHTRSQSKPNQKHLPMTHNSVHNGRT